MLAEVDARSNPMGVKRGLEMVLLLLLCLPVVGNCDDDEAVLRQIKLELWPRAYREQDTALLDRLLASEFELIEADGNISTKAAELDYVSRHRPSYEHFRYEIERLEIFGGDTAIVAGQGHVEGTDAEGVYLTRYRSTNVLVKRDGRWQAVASHVSGVERTRPEQ
jgi:hypothetical protein